VPAFLVRDRHAIMATRSLIWVGLGLVVLVQLVSMFSLLRVSSMSDISSREDRLMNIVVSKSSLVESLVCANSLVSDVTYLRGQMEMLRNEQSTDKSPPSDSSPDEISSKDAHMCETDLNSMIASQWFAVLNSGTTVRPAALLCSEEKIVPSVFVIGGEKAGTTSFFNQMRLSIPFLDPGEVLEGKETSWNVKVRELALSASFFFRIVDSLIFRVSPGKIFLVR